MHGQIRTQIAYSRVGFRAFYYAQQEEEGMGGRTCRMLVPGEAPDENLDEGGVARPAVAATEVRPRARERVKACGAKKEKKDGRVAVQMAAEGGSSFVYRPDCPITVTVNCYRTNR